MPVLDRDLGWNRIKRDLKNLDGSYTKVGLPEKGSEGLPRRAGSGHDFLDMSDLIIVGAANEFGTARTPERSFLRSTTDEQRPNISRVQKKVYEKIVTAEISVKNGLALLGEFLTGKVKNKIRTLKTPANKPSTIKRKKSSNPLIDTAQMLQSIQHEEVVK